MASVRVWKFMVWREMKGIKRITVESCWIVYGCCFQFRVRRVWFVQGTMRVLLVLLHDFPEFLCDYHYAFCDVIPPNCIQVRNLVLSAFPRNMRLPDPFTPNLKVDMLPEIAHAPRVMSNFVSFIQPQSFKKVDFSVNFLWFLICACTWDFSALTICLQCFDTVGWVAGRAYGL